MAVQTKRVRDTDGNVTTLDLTSASASNRRLNVTSPGDANASGTSFKGFTWHKSAAVATDVTIYRVDAADSDTLYKLEEVIADASTDGVWRPSSEEASGIDSGKPSTESSAGWRIQFSQAGAPCTCHVMADFKII